MSAVPVTERVIAMTTTQMLQLIRRPSGPETQPAALSAAYAAARDHDWRRMLPVISVLGVVACLTSIPLIVLFNPPARPESVLLDLGLAAAFGVSFRTVRNLPDRRLPWLYAVVCWLGLAAAGVSAMLGGALTLLAVLGLVMLPVAVALFAHWTARSQALWCVTSLIALAAAGRIPGLTDRAVNLEWQETLAAFGYSTVFSVVGMAVLERARRTFVHPDDLRSVWDQVRQQEGPTTVGDFRVRPRVGRDLWVTATASPLRSTDEATHGHLVMLTDISARRTMEERLRQLNETLRGMVDRDGLTGVLNRRALERVFNDPPLHQRGVGVLLIDVDRFKEFNDTRGHQAGDDALRRLAALLGADLRGRDRVFRYGGEEFLILLDDVDPASALAAAERLRNSVDVAGTPERGGAARRLPTISAGVAVGSLDEPGALNHLIEAADAALYAAKEAGRNRVTPAAIAPTAARQAPTLSPTPSPGVAASLSRRATLHP